MRWGGHAVEDARHVRRDGGIAAQHPMPTQGEHVPTDDLRWPGCHHRIRVRLAVGWIRHEGVELVLRPEGRQVDAGRLELAEHRLIPLETEFRGAVVRHGEGFGPLVRDEVQVRALDRHQFGAVALDHREAQPCCLRRGDGLVAGHNTTVSIDEHRAAGAVRADRVRHGLTATGRSPIRVVGIARQVR